MCLTGVLTDVSTGVLTDGSTAVLTDVSTGVLTRCLVSLEQKDIDGSKSTETSDALREVFGLLCIVRDVVNVVFVYC